MGAAKYNRSFTWLSRSVAKDANTGEDVETFTSLATIWGQMKPLSAAKRMAYGVTGSQADVEITLSQFPSIDAKDRLRDKRFNELWVIDGVYKSYDTNETVVLAHSVQGVFP